MKINMKTTVNTNGKTHIANYFTEEEPVLVYRVNDDDLPDPTCGTIKYIGNYYESKDPRIELGNFMKSINPYLLVQCMDGEQIWVPNSKKSIKKSLGKLPKTIKLTKSMLESLVM